MLACNTVHEDFAKFSLHGSPMFHQERGRMAKTQDPGEDYSTKFDTRRLRTDIQSLLYSTVPFSNTYLRKLIPFGRKLITSKQIIKTAQKRRSD